MAFPKSTKYDSGRLVEQAATDVTVHGMPLDTLPAELLTVPANRQYLVYGSLTIADGCTLDAVGDVIIL